MSTISSNVVRVRKLLEDVYSLNGTIEDGWNVIDLLTDMMHFCDYYGMDFEAAIETARMHHTAETKG
jgi:hypothetical protein